MKKSVLIGMSLWMAGAACAGDFLQWQDTSLSGLYGTGFKVDPETQQTLTVEHASGWSIGDLYFFTDFIYFDGETAGAKGKSSYYGELAPRLSAGKIINKDLSVLFVKDWLLAGCYEFGEDATGKDFGLQNYLIGPAVDLEIPYFEFFQLNLYRRFNDGKSDPQSYQLTPAWRLPIPLGKSVFIFDGYVDWVFGDGTDNLHVNPQFKFDVGVFAGLQPRALLIGVEYDYWKNKYDIPDSDAFPTTQSAYSAMLQYHF